MCHTEGPGPPLPRVHVLQGPAQSPGPTAIADMNEGPAEAQPPSGGLPQAKEEGSAGTRGGHLVPPITLSSQHILFYFLT